MNRLTSLHVRMHNLPSRSRGLTTVEMIMLVVIAATFIATIAYFVQGEMMEKMLKSVRVILGFQPNK